MPVLFLVLGAVTAFLNPRFLSPNNLATPRTSSAFRPVLARAGIVIITGGIDLSVGSVFALLGVVYVDLLAAGSSCWRRRSWSSLGGVVLGVINGFLITRLRLQPFIVTLCGLLIYRGIARYYTNDGTAGLEDGQSFPTLEWLAAGRRWACRILHHVRVVSAIMGLVLHRSVFGRYLFAVGKNEEAARYSASAPTRGGRGLRISGGLTGLSAIFLAMYTRSISPAITVISTSSTASPPRSWAAAGCAAARVRSSASCWAPPAADPAEPGEPARHPELAQLRGDGRRDPDRRRGRPAAHAAPGTPGEAVELIPPHAERGEVARRAAEGSWGTVLLLMTLHVPSGRLPSLAWEDVSTAAATCSTCHRRKQ